MKFPDAPAVVAFVIPVGVCTAITDAPDTFTSPLSVDVVSTSDSRGMEVNKTANSEGIIKNFFNFIIRFILINNY